MLVDFGMDALREAVLTERVNARLTQDDIATSLGCSRKWVSRFERGMSEPDIGRAAAYAALFGIVIKMEIPDRVADLTAKSRGYASSFAGMPDGEND